MKSETGLLSYYGQQVWPINRTVLSLFHLILYISVTELVRMWVGGLEAAKSFRDKKCKCHQFNSNWADLCIYEGHMIP